MADAVAKRDAGAFILDVRQPEEWNEFHVPESTLIPLDQLASRVNELPKDKEIVIVCDQATAVRRHATCCSAMDLPTSPAWQVGLLNGKQLAIQP